MYTWDQLRGVFLVRYYLVTKKLNYKVKVNNFVALPGESESSSWDKFTIFLRGIPNHRIDDESLKEYFYRDQDDNKKEVLDIIVGYYYGECTYTKTVEKWVKISHKNKDWSTRKSDTGRNTLAVETTNKSIVDEIHKVMWQIRIGLGFVLKHVTGGAKKINAVNYLMKPPPTSDHYYHQ